MSNYKDLKVGLVTYHKALSYGACLQAFATAYVIENNLNYIVEFVDYENEFESRQKGWGFIKYGSFKEIIITLVKRFIFGYEKYKKRAFENFLNYQKISSVSTSNIRDLDKLQYDILVVGSDQVWNPKISNEIDPVFLLDFGSAKKRISYASSMGGYVFNDEDKSMFSEKINNFDHISVREAHTKKQLKEFTNKEIKLLLDPTLLIGGAEWRGLAKNSEISYKFEEKSYILAFYFGEMDPKTTEMFNHFSKTLNLPIYRVMLNNYKSKSVDKVIAGPTPFEFIDLIDNARFVITNSFHGTAFCINLNTNFIQIPMHNNNQRMDELLELTGLKKQSLNHNTLEAIPTNVDFSYSNKILEEKRKTDIDWIKKVFEC